MRFTLNKHVKWRVDKLDILICDCKKMVDLKLPLRYEEFMKKLERGIEEEKLGLEEKKVFSDFKKMNLISKLNIRKIKKEEFNSTVDILDNRLGKNRVRGKEFLFEKFEKYPEFFIGIFLDKELIGMVCGFPREDYLLISEIAVDKRFCGRGFGKRLVEIFEKTAKRKYGQINVGAEDNVIGFYEKLNYKPFLLIQFKEKDYKKEDFDDFHIIKEYNFDSKNLMIEAEINKCNLNLLNKLRDKYPKAHFQYIFTKKIV